MPRRVIHGQGPTSGPGPGEPLPGAGRANSRCGQGSPAAMDPISPTGRSGTGNYPDRPRREAIRQLAIRKEDHLLSVLLRRPPGGNGCIICKIQLFFIVRVLPPNCKAHGDFSHIRGRHRGVIFVGRIAHRRASQDEDSLPAIKDTPAGCRDRPNLGQTKNLGGLAPLGREPSMPRFEESTREKAAWVQALRATLAAAGRFRLVWWSQRPASGAPCHRCKEMEQTCSRSSSSRTSRNACGKPARTWVEDRPR